MAKEDETPAEEEQVVAPEETPEETPGETPAEEIEETVTDDEEEVEAAEEEVPAEPPSVVERALPNAAKVWGKLSVEQQDAIHGDVVRFLQTEPGDSAEDAHGGQEQPGPEPAASGAAVAPAGPLRPAQVALGDGISDDEWGAVEQYFNDDPKVIGFFQKIRRMDANTRNIAKATVEALDSLGETTELGEARAAHKRELVALGQEGSQTALKRARELKRERRVSNLTDGLSVALFEKGKPAPATERTAAPVASSLASSGKGKGKPRPQKPKRFGSPSEAYQWNLDHPKE